MGEKLVIGPFNKGQKTDREPFYIDNDNFPTIINAYQWRGRVKRKRGTVFLTRLTSYFGSDSISYFPTPGTQQLDGSGNGQLVTFYGLPSTISVQSGSVVIISVTTGFTYTDDGQGNLLNVSNVIVGSVNYATGAFTIASEANSFVNVHYNYYRGYPVMGLEDFIQTSNPFPGTIAFDTVYSYNISTTSIPATSYKVSWYKNVPSGTYTDGSNPNVQKNRLTPSTWNGQDYQQFWTTNYQGALFATNGLTVPFSFANVGMSFVTPSSTTYVGINATTTQMQFVIPVTSGIIVNDFVFANEFTSVTPANAATLNLQTGYVTARSDAGPNRTIVVTFPNAAIANDTYSGGILQALTKQVNTTLDSIRWYDGDPTGGTYPPVTSPGLGWVNFTPPLSQNPYSIADLPLAIYYLVTAKIIFPFKDRLLFIGPVVQTSTGSPIYLPDTVIYSQNGTPYYTSSFKGPPLNPTSNAAILTPINQTASPSAYFCDQPGFGGWAQVGIDENINTASLNENVLILGMDTHQVRMVYTSNDIFPFNFYIINSELGSSSTFSAINMDKAVLTRGTRGYIMTSQVETQRFDLDIPDSVFEINALNNGTERMCAQRDFINEWVYFTFPSGSISYNFPNSTLFYNYRDGTWAQFFECYTTYGQWRQSSRVTWATIGSIYPTWSVWDDPWNAGTNEAFQPVIIGGNQQGFVMIKDKGTGEETSLYISSISNGLISSPNHCLNPGDFIYITGVLGTSGTYLNNKVFSVVQNDSNSFYTNPTIPNGTTYLGNGLITRLYIPYIQTKQFPVAWGLGRKTRIGVQQYLLSTTPNAQIQLLIFLSQNSEYPYNTGNIIPQIDVDNSSLIYSTILYTCPESTNLGLTPANTNLQMVTATNQNQIWHRINTSLLGDTVQLGFTISQDQMATLTPFSTSAQITGATQTNPCVLTCNGAFGANTLIKITDVVGMTQLNFNPNNYNYWQVLSSTSSTVTINVDATGFSVYNSGGTATPYGLNYQIAEVELHGAILDVTPSQLLS